MGFVSKLSSLERVLGETLLNTNHIGQSMIENIASQYCIFYPPKQPTERGNEFNECFVTFIPSSRENNRCFKENGWGLIEYEVLMLRLYTPALDKKEWIPIRSSDLSIGSSIKLCATDNLMIEAKVIIDPTLMETTLVATPTLNREPCFSFLGGIARTFIVFYHRKHNNVSIIESL